MAVADAKLRKDKSEPLFRQKDLLIILDGRSPTNTENMARELQRTLKEAAGLPARKYTVLRRFYSNTEFETGYCSPKRRTAIHPKLADPLENMFMVIPKTFNMPFRESPAPTMVSDNRARGWVGLKMKTQLEQSFAAVSLDTYLAMAGKNIGDIGSGETLAEDIAALMGDEDGEIVPDGDEAQDAKAKELEKPSKIMACPWEGPEADYDLLLTLYKGNLAAGANPRVIAVESGSGSLATACVRRA